MPALRRPGCGTSQGGDGSLGDATLPDPFMQNLFVLCHGEQVRYADVQKGVRTWDPPLTERGKLQAWRVGRTIRTEGWNITRVVMSPSLRCVQTAVEVIAGLCMKPSSVAHDQKHEGNHSSPSIKASIEYGLAEVMKGRGVLYPAENSDKEACQPWTLDLAELYSMLPSEIQDSSFQPIRQKLPSNRESVAEVQYRYTSTFQNITNRFPHENILCITHGEGVTQLVSMMWPRVKVYAVSYCAYTHGQRPNFECDDGSSVTNGDWELLTESGMASGIFYTPCSPYL